MATAERPRTIPGSRADLLVQIVTEEAGRLGRGLTTGEIRDAVEARIKSAAPKSLTSEIHSLARRGILEVTGGRAGRSLYAPAGAGLRGQEDAEDGARLVLEALRHGYRRLRRPLSTREVAAELERLNLKLGSESPNAVKKYLETLSKARIRGAKGFRAAQVRRVASEAITGAPAAFWVPARSEVRAPVVPRSAADAARAAVGAATLELGRPISAAELRWWMDTEQARAVHGGVLELESLGRVLADTAGADARYEGDERRLHTCPTWWTSYGGQPVRYSMGPPSEEQLLACEFTDMLEILRPADELESIAGLRRRAEGIGSWPLTAVANMRERLLHDLFADWGGGVNKAQALKLAARAFATLKRWVTQAEPRLTSNQVEKRTQVFRTWERQIHAGVSLFVSESVTRPRPLSIGTACRIAMPDLEPLLTAAGRWLELPDERALQRLVARARRVPNRAVNHRDRFEMPSSITYLDRVDALLAIWEAIPSPRAAVLLRDASETLGYVLRDSRVLYDILAERGPRDDYARRTLVVCLGLLGEPVDPDIAIKDWSRYDDTVAWVLSTVLADPRGAASRIEVLDAKIESGESRVTDTALVRLRAGAPFSVIG